MDRARRAMPIGNKACHARFVKAQQERHKKKLREMKAKEAVEPLMALYDTGKSKAEVIAALAEIDEVLEIHTITGDVDLLCKVVARSNDHLHEIVLAITSLPPVRHSQTQLALHTSHRRGLVDVL